MLTRVVAVVALATAAGAAVPGTTTPPSAVKPNVVKITTRNYSFEMPDRIPAGPTTFELTNVANELHHVQLVRLDSGKTLEQFLAGMKNPGPPPAWAVFVGGPNAPKTNGGTSTAVVNLKAGNYAVICLIPSPGSPAPHFTKGMVHPLTVTPVQTVANSMPTADITITTSDYAFALSKPITKGMHSIKLRNTIGPQMHEIVIVRLAAGKTAADMVKWVQSMTGPEPGEAIGGITALGKDEEATFFANFTPGDYAMYCFIPGPDGKDHAMHGMVKAFSIK